MTQSNIYTLDQVTKVQWKLDGIELSGDNTFQELMKVSKLIEQLPSFEDEMNKIASTLDDMTIGESVPASSQPAPTKWESENEKAQKKATVLRALKPLSFQEKHTDLQLRRTEGLGQWLLTLPDFVDWQEGTFRSNTLWCYGNPGAGKTFLSFVHYLLRQ